VINISNASITHISLLQALIRVPSSPSPGYFQPLQFNHIMSQNSTLHLDTIAISNTKTNDTIPSPTLPSTKERWIPSQRAPTKILPIALHQRVSAQLSPVNKVLKVSKSKPSYQRLKNRISLVLNHEDRTTISHLYSYPLCFPLYALSEDILAYLHPWQPKITLSPQYALSMN